LQILQHIGKDLVCLDLSGTVNGSLTDEGLRAIYKYCKCLEELDFSMCKKLTLTTIIPLLQKPETAMLIRKLFVSTKKV
jgi:hypothetical protein